jgi:hypothetical protein
VVRLTSFELASVAQVAAMDPGVLGACLDLPIEGREWAVRALQGSCRAPSALPAMPALACGLSAQAVVRYVHDDGDDDDCEEKEMETDDAEEKQSDDGEEKESDGGEGKDSDGGEDEKDQPGRTQRSCGVNQRAGFEDYAGTNVAISLGEQELAENALDAQELAAARGEASGHAAAGGEGRSASQGAGAGADGGAQNCRIRELERQLAAARRCAEAMAEGSGVRPGGSGACPAGGVGRHSAWSGTWAGAAANTWHTTTHAAALPQAEAAALVNCLHGIEGLRHYQSQAMDCLRSEGLRHLLVVSSAGSGKSLVAIGHAALKPDPVVVACPHVTGTESVAKDAREMGLRVFVEHMQSEGLSAAYECAQQNGGRLPPATLIVTTFDRASQAVEFVVNDLKQDISCLVVDELHTLAVECKAGFR